MIHLTADSAILIATQPADFRKGIDGFVGLCQQNLAQNPRSGSLYVFINRAATMIRILAYDQQGRGYWLMSKRLSRGRYRGWPRRESAIGSIQAHPWRQLLRGVLAPENA